MSRFKTKYFKIHESNYNFSICDQRIRAYSVHLLAAMLFLNTVINNVH